MGPLTQDSTFSIECTNGTATGNASIHVTTTPATTGFQFQQSWDDINDVAWNPDQQVLYLAVGSAGNVNPNTVMAFDPVQGVVTTSVWACSEPNALAISEDNQFLYVGCAGTDIISRYRLPALTLDAGFPFDPENRAQHGPAVFPDQLAIAPGAPLTLAVASRTHPFPPGATYFRVLDDQVPRPMPYPSYSGIAAAWGKDSSSLFVSQVLGATDALSTSPMGSSVIGTVHSTASQSASTIQHVAYDNGLLYDAGVDIFDAQTLQPLAVLPSEGYVTIDAANGTLFAAIYNQSTSRLEITSYNLGTRAIKGRIVAWSAALQTGLALVRRMVRWGSDGLAVVDQSGHLGLISGPFVASKGTGTPVSVIPGTDPCCTHGSLNFTPSVNATGVYAADLVWDSAHSLLIASIPASDPNHPNTLAAIDPTSGNVLTYVPTNVNPAALAISDDSQYLYVGEPSTYQRFLLPALTLDATYPQTSGIDIGTTAPPIQITVRPGDPHTVTVLSMLGSSERHYLYRDGVEVNAPNTNALASWLQWSSDGATLYGSDAWNGDYPTLWSAEIGAQTLVQLGTPFSYPIGENVAPVYGLTFTSVGGLLYSDAGAIFDPATGGWPGTLPLSNALGGLSGTSLAFGPLAIDSARHRAYSAACLLQNVNSVCGVSVSEVNLDTFTPLAVGALFDIYDEPLRIYEISPTSVVVLAADGQVLIVSSPNLGK